MACYTVLLRFQHILPWNIHGTGSSLVRYRFRNCICITVTKSRQGVPLGAPCFINEGDLHDTIYSTNRLKVHRH